MLRVPVPSAIVGRVRAACAHLPEAYEEQPGYGVVWRIRGATLADLRARPGDSGTVTHVTFHARDELKALVATGHPFYPGWGGGLVAMVLTEDDTTDWDEVRELLTESYCLLAPKKLIASLKDRPGS